ncbi:MAG: NACHT domain-containing protein [Desulfobacteraceae bacterium]|nr:NACHT domain-containing protein [Desulfobacteraceae bacterium]
MSTQEVTIRNTIGFSERYLEYLKNVHSHLKFKGLSHGHIPNIALNSIYITLKATSGETHQEERHLDIYKSDQSSERLQRSKESTRTQFLETAFYQAEEQIHHKLPAESLLTEHSRLVIIGEPGSGKTTLLDYLILELLENPNSYQSIFNFPQQPVPLFIQLRFIEPNNLPNLDTLSKICLPEILHSEFPNSFFRQYINQGCSVFFFDGLDEVTIPQERRKVSNWIDELSAAFPNNRYIVTSRIIGYREAPLHNGFHKFRLCDFDKEDIKQFVFNWQTAVDMPHPNEADSDRNSRIRKEAERLLSIMEEKPGIRQLASNPLLLTIVLLVYNSRTRLPEERGRLYDECIDVLLEHIQKARLDEARDGGAFKPTQGLKLEQQRDLLKSTALWLHERGLREENKSKICNQVLANQFPAIGLDPLQAEPFIKEVEQRSGLIIHRGSGIGFSHLTFQEYLTALELCDNEDMHQTIDFLAEHRLHSWWHEVIQLYAASMVDAGILIRRLLEEPDTELHHTLLLSGQCLADARKVKDLNLRKQVIQKLTDLYQETPFSYVRFQARQVLVRIGTPEVARVFTDILENNKQDILQVRDAVEVLSRLHTGADIRQPLIELAKNSKLPEEIIQTALRGLQNAGQFDEKTESLLFSFMTEDHPIRTRQEAVSTLSKLTSDPNIVQRIRYDILENDKYTDHLDEVYIAASKGFIKHFESSKAIRLLTSKMAIPQMAEYKVELCRAMTYIKAPEETLLETLISLMKHGIDWGARGGAALALGLLKLQRERIAHELADCLARENDIGVRLRIADALGHLGWNDEKVSSILKNRLEQEHHLQTRWKLAEAYALLTQDEDFIEQNIVSPITGDKDEKNRLYAFEILCKLEYYTDDLIHRIIEQLPVFSQPACKQAMIYLSAAPAISESDRPGLRDFLRSAIDNEKIDRVLRNRAFETLYNLYDLLIESDVWGG